MGKVDGIFLWLIRAWTIPPAIKQAIDSNIFGSLIVQQRPKQICGFLKDQRAKNSPWSIRLIYGHLSTCICLPKSSLLYLSLKGRLFAILENLVLAGQT